MRSSSTCASAARTSAIMPASDCAPPSSSRSTSRRRLPRVSSWTFTTATSTSSRRGAQLHVALGLPLLAGERADLRLNLGDHVLEALQVHLGALESALGRLAPILVLPDPGGLLEQATPLLGAIREDRVDHLVLDDVVGVRAETGVPAQVGDVLEAADRAIDRVVAAAVAIDDAADLDLFERDGEETILVREPHVHRAPVHGRRFTLPWKIASSILAPRIAVGRCSPRTQRIASLMLDLSAPVRTDDGGDALVELDLGRVREGLEPVYAEGA
jgi:hypothetical protein